MDALEARKAALETEMRSIPLEEPVLLHPSLSDVYRGKVANLVEALNAPGTKTEATEIIRSLLSEIRLIPEGDKLCIDLVGELAGLLSLGANKNARSLAAAGGSVTMVAGVGFEPTTFRL